LRVRRTLGETLRILEQLSELTCTWLVFHIGGDLQAKRDADFDTRRSDGTHTLNGARTGPEDLMSSDEEGSDEAIEQEHDLEASPDVVPADEEDEELEEEAEVEEEDRETDKIKEREDEEASSGT
jgi:hypothetical protein